MKRSPLIAACLAAAFAAALTVPTPAHAQSEEDVRAAMSLVNAQLEVLGADFRVEVAEFLTVDQVGRTVIFSDRGNKQLGHHFVPNDPRRAWGVPDGISFAIDTADSSADVDVADSTAAIYRAMATWAAQSCSDIGLTDFGPYPFDVGYVQALLGFGGIPNAVGADVLHAGWLGAAFFDAIAPGGSGFILGVTFTFTFTGGDTNGDGRGDTAFREIYYNDAFNWAIDGNIDIETVALHEAGHGLSQAHFGEAFIKKNGTIQFNPRAVMNATYSGVQQSLRGTDKGGHCSNWGSWPNQ